MPINGNTHGNQNDRGAPALDGRHGQALNLTGSSSP
jgi:hypothetical protein